MALPEIFRSTRRRTCDPVVLPEPWVRTPDVVLVVLESFRADVVGSRFGNKAVTPTIDALALGGVGSGHAYRRTGTRCSRAFISSPVS